MYFKIKFRVRFDSLIFTKICILAFQNWPKLNFHSLKKSEIKICTIFHFKYFSFQNFWLLRIFKDCLFRFTGSSTTNPAKVTAVFWYINECNFKLLSIFQLSTKDNFRWCILIQLNISCLFTILELGKSLGFATFDQETLVF